MAVLLQSSNNSEVQTDIEKLHDINKKQEEQIQSLETKVIHLTNLYFVFQGVILSSISSASPVKCRKSWIPFCLSLIAAFLNLVSVFGTITYFLRCSEELDQNYEDIQTMRSSGMTRAQVNAVEPGSSSSKEEGITRPRADPFEQWKRKLFCYAAMGLLLGFSGIILYGCRALLCDTTNDKCVKLC
ncbi:hypothetical protein FH972_012264 [Carpinus fangiana]|uniref:Uncharacterized protein n=1 Tax=Carpinus fangiana TaxID=176857 RepID=A0A5N6R6D7_9ROSI|nr:hypothetical protein FH972_012264 [Carpinus fangiana]